MTLEVTRLLAEFSVKTGYDDIPIIVREQAKIAIADAIGTLLAGRHEPSVVLLREQALGDFRNGKASVLGYQRQLTAPGAALANAAAAHALDYDNISVLIGFVASPVLFALLAVAEVQGNVSGRELLTSFIIGWEVEAAIARGLGERGVYHYAKGWHSTATLGHFGAAVAVARLLKLDLQRTRYAIGIAASEASGLRTMIGNMVNAFHVGKAARNGIIAAQLAERGFTAHANVLETDWGFCNAFNGLGRYDLNAMLNGLGNPYDLVNPGLWIKAYACCGLIHSAIDGVLDLKERHCLNARQIKHVRISVHELVPPTMHINFPQNPYEAKFCAPFCIASALCNGSVKLGDFTEERVRDSEMQSVMRRVEMVVHPELHGHETFLPPKEFTDVSIELIGGRKFECRIWRGHMRGMRVRPLTGEQLREKFIECAASYCDSFVATRTFDMLNQIELIQDIREITACLV